MSVQINTLVLNTEQELKSFPLNQSIKIKFSEQVEDSQLASCIALIRNLSETGLFNHKNLFILIFLLHSFYQRLLKI